HATPNPVSRTHSVYTRGPEPFFTSTIALATVVSWISRGLPGLVLPELAQRWFDAGDDSIFPEMLRFVQRLVGAFDQAFDGVAGRVFGDAAAEGQRERPAGRRFHIRLPEC